MQLMEREEERVRVCQVVNELAKQTTRGNLTVHWWLPLDTVSYMSIDEASQANVEMLNVNAVAYGLPHQSVANCLTVELTVLKEISQALADLFGLRLPVSCKKQAH